MRPCDVMHVTAVVTKPPENKMEDQIPTANQKRIVSPAGFHSNRPKHIHLSSFRSSNQGIGSFRHWTRDVAVGIQPNKEAMRFFHRRKEEHWA